MEVIKTTAVAFALGLLIAGCGRPPSETPLTPEGPATAVTPETRPLANSGEPTRVEGIAETPVKGAESLQNPSHSPFAQASPALKYAYNGVLTACENGNYPRAIGLLRLLAEAPGLTAEQADVIQALLEQVRKAAPESATNLAANVERLAEAPAASTVQNPTAVAPGETRPGGGEFTRKSLASAFAQANPALKESYDSVLVAIQVGNYDRAVSELELLSEAPGLTMAQRQALLDLLADMLKAAPELLSNSATDGARQPVSRTPR